MSRSLLNVLAALEQTEQPALSGTDAFIRRRSMVPSVF